jgi:hypothetical protein
MSITSNIQQQVFELLLPTSRISLVSTDQEPDSGLGLTSGQRVTAEVLTVLPDSRAQVQIGAQRFNMELPMPVRTGQILEMTFISSQPRLTFAIASQGDATPPVSLSDATRFLKVFLDATNQPPPAGATPAILRTLLEGPPENSARMGQMLQRGLRESGMFYESHLARWFGGEYPLEDILREPQGQLSQLRQPQTVAPQAEELTQTIMPQRHNGIADQRALPVLQEQLAAIQNGQVLFRGDLFPGQKIEWSVAERDAYSSRQGERKRNWDTSLTLDLPKLGAVKAHLSLDGTRVSIDIRANDADSAGLLNKGCHVLVEQMEAAGLTPGEIGVRHGAA